MRKSPPYINLAIISDIVLLCYPLVESETKGNHRDCPQHIAMNICFHRPILGQ